MELKTETFVYADSDHFLYPDNSKTWEWLLNQLPDVEVLRVEGEDYIEFKTTVEILHYLERLLDYDYETIFYGTLEQFYESISEEAL